MWVSLSRYNFGTSVAFLQSEEEHMRYWKFLALPTLIAAWLSIPSSAPAQVSINIGAEPVCPDGYYDAAPYNCAHTGTTGPSGSVAAVSSEPDLCSTALATSTATSIT